MIGELWNLSRMTQGALEKFLPAKKRHQIRWLNHLYSFKSRIPRRRNWPLTGMDEIRSSRSKARTVERIIGNASRSVETEVPEHDVRSSGLTGPFKCWIFVKHPMCNFFIVWLSPLWINPHTCMQSFSHVRDKLVRTRLWPPVGNPDLQVKAGIRKGSPSTG